MNEMLSDVSGMVKLATHHVSVGLRESLDDEHAHLLEVLAKHGPTLIKMAEAEERNKAAVELAAKIDGMESCTDDYGMHFWCPACRAGVDDEDGYGRPNYDAPDMGVKHEPDCKLDAYRATKPQSGKDGV